MKRKRLFLVFSCIAIFCLSIFFSYKFNNNEKEEVIRGDELLVIEVENAGDLAESYDGCNSSIMIEKNYYGVKVIGEINNDDFKCFTMMRNYYELDLSEAIFIGDEITHIIGSNAKNVDYAKDTAMRLERVILPKGEYALADYFFQFTQHLEYVDVSHVTEFGKSGQATEK